MNKEIKIQAGSNQVPLQGLGVGSTMFYGALPILFELAKELRNNQTEAEIFLWENLGHLHELNVRFKRQHPISYFIADFYCHKAKLIIEVDGGYHNIPEQYLYDKNRDSELENLGLKVIRFTNKQVLYDIERTLNVIEMNIIDRISIHEDLQDDANLNSPLGAGGNSRDETNSIPLQGLGVRVRALFSEQLSNWELAQNNYAGLKTVQTKSFDFGDFEVKVQFNPARMISSGAKVDAKTIASRPCFLCAANRPAEQKAIQFGDYEILVNPFPIFPEHFTIPRREHVAQQIKPFFSDMLELAKALDDYLIFYNGPQCGASAPDHIHFQAGTKDFLPLLNDYHRLKDTHTDMLVSTEKMQLFQMKNYLRTVYCIESTDIESAKDSFEKLYNHLSAPLSSRRGVGGEVMMNIVCTYEAGKWFVFVLPRKAFRPWQYNAEGDKQLLVSPATVEMCGIFITPVESHFERITKQDIQSILKQVSS